MISLTGKRIFVSGAAAGMGYSVARLAAAAGGEVYATDISSDGLQSLRDEGVHADVLDVTEQADVSAYFAAKPKILMVLLIWPDGFITAALTKRS